MEFDQFSEAISKAASRLGNYWEVKIIASGMLAAAQFHLELVSLFVILIVIDLATKWIELAHNTIKTDDYTPSLVESIKAVAHMENVDGTTGPHWTFAEVEEEAKRRNIDHPADLYYAINMLYSDLSNVLGKDPEKYIAVAKALYWDDPDMPEGKLFKQYVATI